jgi:hypothetical protein
MEGENVSRETFSPSIRFVAKRLLVRTASMSVANEFFAISVRKSREAARWPGNALQSTAAGE